MLWDIMRECPELGVLKAQSEIHNSPSSGRNFKMTDEQYILKLKSLNWTDARIAEKMGLQPAEVNRIWTELLSRTENAISTGYVQLAEFYNNTAAQYKLLGESLETLGKAMGDLANPESLKTFMRESDVECLLKHYIVLNKFIPPTSSESLPPSQNKN